MILALKLRHPTDDEQALKNTLQNRSATREIEDLQNAIKLYQNAITDRDDAIANYKAMLLKLSTQLPHRIHFKHVNDELMKQLHQTKRIIALTFSNLLDCRALPASARSHLKSMLGDHLANLKTQLQHLQAEITHDPIAPTSQSTV
ncbi:hypothetical protein CCR75_005862 [Bremia lactucae]|uniref:Uncharacterized protein n=1 Tax=Bremia lactucae TaxID=4779 RepID=A0A976IBR5_BRELC|nr:hypothetical protein CCR75_005862 [Bremia lactucae]